MESNPIKKSSKGRMNTTEREKKIVKREFEENNPKPQKYPSFRRNFKCD
jgi:hypothetical protein